MSGEKQGNIGPRLRPDIQRLCGYDLFGPNLGKKCHDRILQTVGIQSSTIFVTRISLDDLATVVVCVVMYDLYSTEQGITLI